MKRLAGEPKYLPDTEWHPNDPRKPVSHLDPEKPPRKPFDTNNGNLGGSGRGDEDPFEGKDDFFEDE